VHGSISKAVAIGHSVTPVVWQATFEKVLDRVLGLVRSRK
jgi:hypothetical protein